MGSVGWSRLQFGFTITYHYLFPQLTMGLALLIVVFKALALRTKKPEYDDLARFWARIFGINFAVGVVTGIPMEFQFGTNWARFSNFSGGVIGLTLAMEGMFAFFAESAFLGLFLFGEKRIGPRAHFVSAFMIFVGSWLSGYFIVATNAFMQHPAGHTLDESGRLVLSDVFAFLFNPWALWQYAHTMSAAVITSAFVVCAVAAYWTLMHRHERHARTALRVGIVAGLIACVMQIFPTGDQHGKMVAAHQPAALAAMEGKFETSTHAELAIIGQPNIEERRLENPIVVPHILSFLAYGSFGAQVKGLDDIPHDEWPDNIELLYYAYHVMVGLGTLLVAIMGIAALLLYKDRLMRTRPVLWVLMLSFPFPYIATTAGWMTAELGRQPWLVYGLMRTVHGSSPRVSSGSVAFTTIGYMGLYTLLSVLFVFLVGRAVARGPEHHGPEHQGENDAEHEPKPQEA
ncbi:Cytochrome d ubiquinol oxidase subunit I [Labilithrix luteola]|uniref:Cytochrome d ubiquinol oxidase subunit I n=1 Tax=Labilithrix luteola TaxID=1391654 RepID=A0A0K1QCD1_9BACT|nr:cytochrome ubiquinol oxidase subunit I [Labilithrix luteola]AKV03404.1 Cytochrome d ubiquinol oxidase subunit I [Labilithrix luteola]